MPSRSTRRFSTPWTRLTLLINAAEALSSTLEVDQGLRRLCRTLIPGLADWCAVDLLDDRGRLRRIVDEHRDADVTSPGLDEGLLPPAEGSAAPVARALLGVGPYSYAVAGHPAPLLVTHDGETRFLTGGRGVMLGVEPEVHRPATTDTLPPDSTVLLYTDGLVEQREEDLDRGLARLMQHAAALAREPLTTFCDEILEGMAGGGSDDVALIAVRTAPPHAGPAGATPRAGKNDITWQPARRPGSTTGHAGPEIRARCCAQPLVPAATVPSPHARCVSTRVGASFAPCILCVGTGNDLDSLQPCLRSTPIARCCRV
ncbi:PP2C family protein-serine/threonine phosphatase [Streptomyces sp. McG3]|uniref:PP2C family protein-serine/threonine phosphatase n=1 Tax=Streptomyces sp. McG3 TaxID=2725483 RepID=UPI002037383E|nr:PP2C family protein-serine/threonine phosphatase [Streptomyces sp. McG3]